MLFAVFHFNWELFSCSSLSNCKIFQTVDHNCLVEHLTTWRDVNSYLNIEELWLQLVSSQMLPSNFGLLYEPNFTVTLEWFMNGLEFWIFDFLVNLVRRRHALVLCIACRPGEDTFQMAYDDLNVWQKWLFLVERENGVLISCWYYRVLHRF